MKKAVSVAIVNEKGQILLEKHVKCKGLWVMPCGKLEENETYEAAAVRELKEELGIEIDANDLITLFQRNSFYSRIDGDQIFDEKVLGLRYNEKIHGKVENLEPEKHTNVGWVDVKFVDYVKDLHISENTRLATDMINSGVVLFNDPVFDNPNFVYKAQSFDLSDIEGQLKLIDYIIEEDGNLSLKLLENTDPDITVLSYMLTPTRFLAENMMDVSNTYFIPLKTIDKELVEDRIRVAKYSHLYRKLSDYLSENNIHVASISTILPEHIDEDKIVRFNDFTIIIRKVLEDSKVKLIVKLYPTLAMPFKLASTDTIDTVLMGLLNDMYRRYLIHSSRNKVLITKITPEAIIPEKAHPTDSGMDLFSVGKYEIQPGKSCLISTGIKIILPPGFEAQIRPKSGLALKQGITVLNTPGTIDEDYRGEIGVILINHGDKPVFINHQQKIAQMVISRVNKVDTAEITNEEYLTFDTERGEGGFGSTGLDPKKV